MSDIKQEKLIKEQLFPANTNAISYKGTKPKKEFNKEHITKQSNSQLFYEPSKKKILLNITQNEQININSKPKPI